MPVGRPLVPLPIDLIMCRLSRPEAILFDEEELVVVFFCCRDKQLSNMFIILGM